MDQSSLRLTISTQLVLGALLVEPTQERYGGEIAALLGLASGTVHPILARLEGLGWVESAWEKIDPRLEGRPPRRYYRLTAAGAQQAGEALARAQRGVRARLRLRPSEG